MPTPTILDKGHLTTNGTTFQTNAVSVGAGELCLIYFYGNDGDTVPSVSSTSMTFTEVDSVIPGDTTRELHCWRAMPGSDVTSEVITIDFGSDTQGNTSYLVEKWADVDQGGTNGADAIVQAVPAVSTVQNTSASATLAAFGSSDNRPTAAIFLTQRSENVSPGTNFTELQEQQSTEGATTLMNEWRDAEDLTTDFSWSSGSHWGIIALELKAAASTKPTTPNAPTETTGAAGQQPVSEYDALAGPDQGSYQWTASGSGTNEYYLEASGGGDPGLTEVEPALSVYMDRAFLQSGTLGSLTDHQIAFGDNDTLGFDTLYIRDDSGDPDTSDVEILYMRATEYIEVTGIDNTLGNDLRIEYQITGDGGWGFSKTVSITGTTQTVQIENLPADRGIDYRAVVVNTDEAPDVESDASSSSGVIRSAPEPPSQVSASEGSAADEIDITFVDQTSPTTGTYPHNVWEVLASDPPRFVGTLPLGETSIIDDGGGAGLDDDTYQYEVRSYNSTADKSSGALSSNQQAVSTAVEVSATKQSFSLTEYAADVTVTHKVEATKQAFTLTTYSADVTVVHKVEATKQAFTLTTYPATITVTPPSVVEVSATKQSFTLNTYAATVTVGDAQAGGDSDDHHRKGNPASFFRPGF